MAISKQRQIELYLEKARNYLKLGDKKKANYYCRLIMMLREEQAGTRTKKTRPPKKKGKRSVHTRTPHGFKESDQSSVQRRAQEVDHSPTPKPVEPSGSRGDGSLRAARAAKQASSAKDIPTPTPLPPQALAFSWEADQQELPLEYESQEGLRSKEPTPRPRKMQRAAGASRPLASAESSAPVSMSTADLDEHILYTTSAKEQWVANHLALSMSPETEDKLRRVIFFSSSAREFDALLDEGLTHILRRYIESPPEKEAQHQPSSNEPDLQNPFLDRHATQARPTKQRQTQSIKTLQEPLAVAVQPEKPAPRRVTQASLPQVPSQLDVQEQGVLEAFIQATERQRQEQVEQIRTSRYDTQLRTTKDAILAEMQKQTERLKRKKEQRQRSLKKSSRPAFPARTEPVDGPGSSRPPLRRNTPSEVEQSDSFLSAPQEISPSHDAHSAPQPATDLPAQVPPRAKLNSMLEEAFSDMYGSLELDAVPNTSQAPDDAQAPEKPPVSLKSTIDREGREFFSSFGPTADAKALRDALAKPSRLPTTSDNPSFSESASAQDVEVRDEAKPSVVTAQDKTAPEIVRVQTEAPQRGKDGFDTLFRHAMGAYLQRNYKQATRLFELCLQLRPHDKVIQYNLTRLKHKDKAYSPKK